MPDRISTIMGGIKTLLQNTSAFDNVWDYDRVQVDPLTAGKGAVTMWWDGFESPSEDSRRNITRQVTTFRIIVRIIAMLRPDRKDTDEANFRARVQTAVNALRADNTLNGTALWSHVRDGQAQFDEKGREVWMDLTVLAEYPGKW